MGGMYTASAVGEVNVVEAIRNTQAIIGGEGNGGIIYPASHSGRDALVGVGLFLSHLIETGLKCSELRHTYPSFVIQKDKLSLPRFWRRGGVGNIGFESSRGQSEYH